METMSTQDPDHTERCAYVDGFLEDLREKAENGRTTFEVQIIDSGVPPGDREKLK